MKYFAALALGALTVAPAAAQTAPAQGAPAAAQTAPAQGAPAAASAAPAVGASIYDSAGVEIGKVESVTADAAVVNTGTAKVALPLTSIGKGAKGASIAMTKAALDAAAAQQQQQAGAALQSRLTAGTQVKGRNATSVIGTIKSADAQNVTVTAANGRDVVLPISGFSAATDGSIIVGLTAEQFNAAVGGGAATGAAPAAGAAAPAAGSAPAAGAPAPTTAPAAAGMAPASPGMSAAPAPAAGATTTDSTTTTTQTSPSGDATTTTTKSTTKKKTKNR